MIFYKVHFKSKLLLEATGELTIPRRKDDPPTGGLGSSVRQRVVDIYKVHFKSKLLLVCDQPLLGTVILGSSTLAESW